MLRKFILAGCFALLASHAEAANRASLSQFVSIGSPAGTVAQIAQEPSLVDSIVDFSGGATQSALFNSRTNYIRVLCDSQCSVSVGINPTATTSNKILPALVPEYFAVPSGGTYRISVIANP